MLLYIRCYNRFIENEAFNMTIRDKKPLLKQIILFVFTGVIATLIDFGIYTLLVYIGIHYMTANIFSFCISLIANYILSMKLVFKGKKERKKATEFIIFAVLSIIGLGISNICLWFCLDFIHIETMLQLNDTIAAMIAKVIATCIVLVYNFISRKIFLEEK